MLHFLIGFALCVAAWMAVRVSAGAPPAGRPGRGRWHALALDGFAPVAGFLLAFAATARPVFAAILIAAPAAGLIVADRVKRRVLREPVVFADRAELFEVVRHPRLYLAFVGLWRMTAGALICVGAVFVLIRVEPPLWAVPDWAVIAAPVVAAVVARLLFVVPALPALNRRLARLHARLPVTRDPVADARTLGLMASFVVHATLARAERPARQAAARARSFALPADAGPILIVQGESFLDPRRIDPALASLAPAFARLEAESIAHGRLAVPAWGANTIRSELAVIAGLGPDALGLDRFNPYEAFAQGPLPSLAHAARAAGYVTVCIHPYNADFYRRDRVMPLIGFDRFVGLEGFGRAETRGGYVTDVAAAAMIGALLAEHGERLFLFCITMENHGPWDGVKDQTPPAALPDVMSAIPQFDALGRWVEGLRRTDAMLPPLADALAARGRGMLLFYGDHQPSLPGAFAAIGLDSQDTDYLLWTPGGTPGPRLDLPAERLAALVERAAAAGR